MAFEVFDGRHSRGGSNPLVSVRKGSALALNLPSTEQWLKQAPYAVLLFDAEAGLAGIRPVQEKGPNAYRVQYSKQGSAQISTRGFSQHYNLLCDRSHSYPAEWDDNAQAIVFKPEVAKEGR